MTNVSISGVTANLSFGGPTPNIGASPLFNIYSITDEVSVNVWKDSICRDIKAFLHAVTLISETGELIYGFSEDDGSTWENDTIYTGLSARAPTICTDKNGILHVAFFEEDPPRLRYMYNDGDWSIPQDITESGEGKPSATYPIIKSDSQNNLHIAFEFEPSKIGYLKYDGESWSEIYRIDEGDDYHAYHQHITITPDDDIMIVWEDKPATKTNIYSKLYDGTWHSQVQVSDGTSNTLPYQLKSDDNGNMHLVYYQAGEIYYQKYTGTWATKVQISDGGNVGDANLSIDGSGHIYITWYDYDLSVTFYSKYDSSWSYPTQYGDIPGIDYLHYSDAISDQHPASVNRPLTGLASIFGRSEQSVENDELGIGFVASEDLDWEPIDVYLYLGGKNLLSRDAANCSSVDILGAGGGEGNPYYAVSESDGEGGYCWKIPLEGIYNEDHWEYITYIGYGFLDGVTLDGNYTFSYEKYASDSIPTATNVIWENLSFEGGEDSQQLTFTAAWVKRSLTIGPEDDPYGVFFSISTGNVEEFEEDPPTKHFYIRKQQFEEGDTATTWENPSEALGGAIGTSNFEAPIPEIIVPINVTIEAVPQSLNPELSTTYDGSDNSIDNLPIIFGQNDTIETVAWDDYNYKVLHQEQPFEQSGGGVTYVNSETAYGTWEATYQKNIDDAYGSISFHPLHKMDSTTYIAFHITGDAWEFSIYVNGESIYDDDDTLDTSDTDPHTITFTRTLDNHVTLKVDNITLVNNVLDESGIDSNEELLLGVVEGYAVGLEAVWTDISVPGVYEDLVNFDTEVPQSISGEAIIEPATSSVTFTALTAGVQETAIAPIGNATAEGTENTFSTGITIIQILGIAEAEGIIPNVGLLEDLALITLTPSKVPKKQTSYINVIVGGAAKQFPFTIIDAYAKMNNETIPVTIVTNGLIENKLRLETNTRCLPTGWKKLDITVKTDDNSNQFRRYIRIME